jgi:hypothetical protein
VLEASKIVDFEMLQPHLIQSGSKCPLPASRHRSAIAMSSSSVNTPLRETNSEIGRTVAVIVMPTSAAAGRRAD